MNELLIGIDWSQSHYDAAVLASDGVLLTQFCISKTHSGFNQLAEKIDKFGLPSNNCHIGLETAHNVLIDFLWSRQYSVYVIAPSIVNSSRGRFGSSGAYTDERDAHLIADLLRTDRVRFAPWRPDSELVTTMKTKLAQVTNMTKLITGQTNRLRAVLWRVYPQAIQAFSDLTSFIALYFLANFPTPSALDTLTYPDFAAFCHQHGYTRNDWITTWYRDLQRPQTPGNPLLAAAYQAEIVFLAQLLAQLNREKKQVIHQIQSLFQQHPDHIIFTSLPGAGVLLQPRLLVMFGQDRDRFPAPQDIQALAGTCPVTKQSGKSRRIQFRRACNHRFRDTAQQFAVSSVQQCDWAATYYNNGLARGLRKNHAYRCLANRWLGIIWKMWQTHQPYDEAYHLQQIHRHRRLN